MEIKVVRFLVYVLAIMYCDEQTLKSVKAKESDETALHEALLLVELLKSEYSRILRERGEPLRNEIDADDKDLETCATTLMYDPDNEAVTTPIKDVGRKVKFSSLKPFTSYYRFLQSRPSYPHQRRFNGYREYYGNYKPPQMWRRMDYENVFGPQPNTTNPTSSTSQKLTVPNPQSADTTLLISTISSPVKDISSTLTSQLPNSISNSITKNNSEALTTSESTIFSNQETVSSPKLPTSASFSTTLRETSTKHKPVSIISKIINQSRRTKALTIYPKQDTKKWQPKKLHLNLEEITSTVPLNDPEQAQIVSELEQELESEIVDPSSSLSPSSHQWRMTWRPTTRIHLAGSTRYPIPLPVNHAFCYTNPESPLCHIFGVAYTFKNDKKVSELPGRRLSARYAPVTGRASRVLRTCRPPLLFLTHSPSLFPSYSASIYPAHFEWHEDEGRFQFSWFSGNQLPDLSDVVLDEKSTPKTEDVEDLISDLESDFDDDDSEAESD